MLLHVNGGQNNSGCLYHVTGVNVHYLGVELDPFQEQAVAAINEGVR